MVSSRKLLLRNWYTHVPKWNIIWNNLAWNFAMPASEMDLSTCIVCWSFLNILWRCLIKHQWIARWLTCGNQPISQRSWIDTYTWGHLLVRSRLLIRSSDVPVYAGGHRYRSVSDERQSSTTYSAPEWIPVSLGAGFWISQLPTSSSTR